MSFTLPSRMRAELLLVGFTSTDDRRGETLVKTMRVHEMPYMREHVVDNDLVFADDVATIRVGQDGTVELATDRGYSEGVVHASSEVGRGILADAGVPLSAIAQHTAPKIDPVMPPPFETPVTVMRTPTGYAMLVSADGARICDLIGADEGQVELIVRSINAFKRPFDATSATTSTP